MRGTDLVGIMVEGVVAAELSPPGPHLRRRRARRTPTLQKQLSPEDDFYGYQDGDARREGGPPSPA